MTRLTLKCDNPSIECNGHSVQIVGTVQITTTPEMLGTAGELFSHGMPWQVEPAKAEKPAKRKALTGGEK